MQKLHLVGYTADFDGLIFSTRKGAKSGNFVVPIDGRLHKQLAEAEQLRGGGSASRGNHRAGAPRLTRPESSLTPREIQDRVRSGWSVDEVAAEAGVDLDWVSRFAAPVLAEVGQVIEQAQALTYDKPRFGLSALPLGPSVRRNVVERGVRMLDEEFDDAWSAYQLDDGVWVVRFVYLSRGREQEAEWRFDLETEELTSRNRLGSQLAHVVKGRVRRPAEPVAKTRKGNRKPPPPPKPAPAKSTTAKKVTAAKAAPPRPAAPRKKAANRPVKKPAKKRPEAPAVFISEDPEPPVWVRPRPAPRPMPVRAPMVEAAPPPPPPPPPPPTRAPAPHVVAVELDEPPQPGPIEIDEAHGIARIDSRRTWHPDPPKPAVFRGEVVRAGEEAPPRRPRRTEPLRGR